VTASDIPALAAYLICVVSVAIYAQRRLATPRSNRSSTRIRLYRQAELGYIACSLILFLVLSSALQYAAMDRLLLGFGLVNIPQLESISKLPAPLIATVLLTVWLPNVFFVRDVDGWLLNAFKSRANIPQEVRDRANRLTPQTFQILPRDLPSLGKLIEEEGLPEELSSHLMARRGEGLQLSRYRLTRVLKLFRELRSLARDPGCQRLFGDYDAEWQAAQSDFRMFCEQASIGLEEARKLRDTVSASEYEHLMAGRRESFGESSARLFAQLALLIAGAVLCKEKTEHGIGERFRTIGFVLDDEPERTDFPLRSLTGLALLLLLYLIVTDLVLHRFHVLPSHPLVRLPVSGPARPFFLVISHAVTIGTTVWLVQRNAAGQRQSGERQRWDVYALCAIVGAAAEAIMWLSLFLLRYGEIPQAEAEWYVLLAVSIMVGSLCGVVAFFCDIGEDRWPGFLPRRITEGLACLVFMGLVSTLVMMEIPLPITRESPLAAVVLVLFRASIAFIVGSFVPYICRAERALAGQRSDPGVEDLRKEIARSDIPTHQAPPRRMAEPAADSVCSGKGSDASDPSLVPRSEGTPNF
jgi:hypothetical protein